MEALYENRLTEGEFIGPNLLVKWAQQMNKNNITLISPFERGLECIRESPTFVSRERNYFKIGEKYNFTHQNSNWGFVCPKWGLAPLATPLDTLLPTGVF